MSRRRRLAAALAACVLGMGAAPLQCPAASQPACVGAAMFPPWQDGGKDDARPRGLEFTVPEADTLADFHGAPADPRLVLFVGGNVFFAMPPLVHAFEAANPDYAGRIYWETLPPVVLVRQMRQGGTITVGDMTWTVRPDAYLAGQRAVRGLIADGTLDGPATSYAVNRLTIMVAAGNPDHIRGLADLARPELRLAMPNPETEGVARQIKAALVRAGGPTLEEAVYGTKQRDGTTTLTQIHHRQTPLFLMQGRADAGVTWASEAAFQEQAGHPITHVDIPPEQNATGIYAGAAVHGAAHGPAAAQFLAFLRSPAALAILQGYGFQPYAEGEE